MRRDRILEAYQAVKTIGEGVAVREKLLGLKLPPTLRPEELMALAKAIEVLKEQARPNLQTEYSLLDHGYVKLIDWMGDDLSPLEAARMSTGNESGVDKAKDDGTRDHLYRNLHTSPFEFGEIVLEIQSPIIVPRQWMRHRTQSYNEFSGRYSVMPDMMWLPPVERVKYQSGFNKQGSGDALPVEIAEEWLARLTSERETIRSNYEWAIEHGIARELARIDLPVAQYTRFRAKANLKNWFGFLALRDDDHAQEEIRTYAQVVDRIVADLFPRCHGVYEEHTKYAKRFSRTEMMVIRSMLAGVSDEDREAEASDFNMTGSRLREFLAKLEG